MKISTLLNLFEVMTKPRGISAFFKWKPFSVTSFQILHCLKKSGFSFNTIIDGGANIGQFARSAVETFPNAKVFSFEPLPDICGKLKKNLDDCPRWRCFNTAIGSRKDLISFHKNSYSHVSSALNLHGNFEKAFPDFKEVEQIKVPVTTLDLALSRIELKVPILLKLDLEGFELEALKGGAKILHIADAVLLETAFEPMYKGQALFSDIEKFLAKKGFRFSKPIDLQRDPWGNIYQIDALFVRTGKK